MSYTQCWTNLVWFSCYTPIMRSVPVLTDMYYHVYNRGNQKQILFLDQYDYVRFLYLLLYFQSDTIIPQTHRQVTSFIKEGNFSVRENVYLDIVQGRHVSLLNFCIMPNHYHLTVHTLNETGLAQYMHRVGNAYAKYFNAKYEKTGHVFQGAYKLRMIESDKQLVYTSAYIHKNPHELERWKNKYQLYKWSSCFDYVDKNRWGALLDTSTIISTFKNGTDYKAYLKVTSAKEYDL